MGKFEMYKDTAGKHRFRLKAGNGEIILSSEAYSSKQSCEHGIESVRANAQKKDNFEIQESSNGKSFFHLKAQNGEIIGNSQMYQSHSGLTHGIESVMTNARDAETVDLLIKL